MWVRQAGEYARQKKIKEHKDTVNTQIREEEEITKQNIEAQINNRPEPEETQPEAPAPQPEQKEHWQMRLSDWSYLR